MRTFFTACLMLTFIWMAKISYAECKALQHGDVTDVLCDQALTDAQKRYLETEREQRAKTAQGRELQRNRTNSSQSSGVVSNTTSKCKPLKKKYPKTSGYDTELINDLRELKHCQDMERINAGGQVSPTRAAPSVEYYGQSSQPKKDVGLCIGSCNSEQGICISQCMGNGQCISNCAVAQGRCVGRCSQ